MFPAKPSIRVVGHMSPESAANPNPELTALAAEAYIYGFSLVFDLQEVDRFTQRGLGSVPPSPFNSFGHATGSRRPTRSSSRSTTTRSTRSRTSTSAAGPCASTSPTRDGRYYVMQFIDAWTNNFAYVGHRATGTDAASFLLVAPGWQGEAPPVRR